MRHLPRFYGLLACAGALLASDSARAASLEACVHQSSGAMRLVSSTTACSANEQRVSWVQDGQQLYGDGSAGARTITGTMVLNDANLQYTDFTVAAGAVLLVPSGVTLRCTGTFTNYGTIQVDYTSNPGHMKAPATGGTVGSFGIPGQGVANGLPQFGEVGNNLANRSGGSGGAGHNAGLPVALRSLVRLGHQAGGGGAGRMNAWNVVAGGGGGAFTVLAKGELHNLGTITANAGLAGAGTGGGGGGVVVLASALLSRNAGTIQAMGGAGGASDSYGGPGGGGGGGIVHLLAPKVANSGTINVSGGAAGPLVGAITQALRQGGGGGGGSGGYGGLGGIAYANGTPGAAAAGTAGLLLTTVADPTSLF